MLLAFQKKCKGSMVIEFTVLFVFILGFMTFTFELFRAGWSHMILQAAAYQGARRAAITAVANNPNEQARIAIKQYIKDNMPFMNATGGTAYVHLDEPQIDCASYEKGSPFKVTLRCTYTPFFTQTIFQFPSYSSTTSVTSMFEDT